MNIKDTIQRQYNIDIDKVNLPKLYKIDRADISPDELEKKFAACRKRWTMSVNGANETFAERDQVHLDNAASYEAILRDKRYLKALLDYYSKGAGSPEAAAAANVEFARSFFTTLKDTNNSVTQKDFDFFMHYFREERKNQEAIKTMLEKEFKAIALKAPSYAKEEADAGESKSKLPGLEQTRFQKESLSLLHKSELQYADLQKSEFLRQKYPALNQTFYDFLRLDEFDETEFAMHVDTAVQEVFTRRQNDSTHNAEYIPLTEYYNTWKDLLKQNDVVSNFHMFKKLARYPKFTPYLFLAEDVNIKFLETLLRMMRDEYNFSSLNDFLYFYFKPLAEGRHYSFSMDKKLEAMIKQISAHPEDSARESKRNSAAAKRRKMIPLPLQILRLMATWPLMLLQLIFETFRFAVVNMQKLAWIVGLMLSLFFSHVMTGNSLFVNLWELVTMFPEKAAKMTEGIVGTANYNNFTLICGSLLTIVDQLGGLILVPVLITLFLYYLAKDLDQSIDLMGYHKTFLNIQQIIEQKLLFHYKKLGNRIYVRMIWPVLANILTIAVIGLIIYLIFALFGFLSADAVLAACL